jgi:hypothetical protein
MKKLLLILLFFTPFLVKAQVDTVCYHSNSATYQVVDVPNNTYTWTVASPGVITSGQGTHIITVNWGTANAGLITNAVSVFPTNEFGCVGPTVLLNVFVLNIIPTFQSGPFCVNAPCVNLVGSPAGGIWSGNGVTGNQFCPATAGVGSSNVTYTYSLGGCTFSVTNPVVVNPLPTISPIQHD